MKKTFLFLSLLFAVGLVFAQTPFTATYTFGADGNVQSFAYNGTTYPGITMSNVDKVGVTTSSSTSNFRATTWPTVSSPDTGKYIGFTITAASGYKFTVNTINFGIGRSSTGTRDTEWRGSADSYGALINNYTTLNSNLTNNSGVLNNPDTNSNWTGNVLTLGSSYAEVTTSCGFRVYLYTAEASGGTAGLAGPLTVTGTITQTGGGSPSIIVNPNTLSDFSYVYGNGPSDEQSFSVTGSNLTANVSVSVTSNYAISSTSGGTFGSSLTLTQSGGDVSATVYVRQIAGLAIDTEYTGTVTCSSTGATDATVSLSGEVTTPPPPDAPVATDESNVANTSFTANWNAVTGATGYYLDVYTGAQTELVNTGFEGSTSFPTGWTQNSSYVQSNSSIAHTGSYYAGMNLADDYFYTPQLSSPTKISFWISASSATANNTTIVQYSSDASTWNDLATYSADGSDTGDVTLTWSQKTVNANLTGDYYIRWFMSARSVGSAYFDDVLITSGSQTYVLQNQNVTSGTSYNVTGLTAGTTYYYVVRAFNAYGTSDDSNEIEVTTTSTSPLITLSASTLTGFTYMEGSGPSAEQSFTVSGSNLTTNISIDAPTNYEISTGTGASFVATDPLTLTQSGGTVGTTTIYVRLKAGLSAGDYNGEVITASSTGATNQTVTCSGTVTPIPDPALDVSVSSLSGFSYIVGAGPSASMYFTVSGTYLTNDIEVTAPTSYEVSADDIAFTGSITLTAAKLDVAETTLYVRLKQGLAIGHYAEDLTVSTTGATNETIALSGDVLTDDIPFLYWDFNDNIPASSTNWTQPVTANFGTGSLTYTFTQAYSYTGTTLNTMAGDIVNGGSFVPRGGQNNEENNGAEFVMTVNTTDLENIVLTYATQRTSTGFTDQAIWYSLDGGQNYTLFTTITSIADSWEVKQIDFTSVTGAKDNPNFMVKIVLTGASSESGNNRFDNISFFGDEEDVNPVELASFTATISAQNYITLTWVTQTETGMRGYYIYRDTDNNFAGAQNVSPLIPSANSSQTQTYMFEDTEVYDTGTYFYWLQTNDMDGTVAFHGPVSVFYNALGDNPTPEIPLVTELKSVYPNPFNPVVFIPFSLAKDSNVSFKIYNARGQIVKHFELGSKAAGNYRITWDGTDYNGAALSNGVYQIVMTAGSQVYQTKTTLLK